MTLAERTRITGLAVRWSNEASRHEKAADEIGQTGERPGAFERDAHLLEAETLNRCADQLIETVKQAASA